MLDFVNMARLAITRGHDRFEFHGRWFVLNEEGKPIYSYPEPQPEQTHADIDNMRATLPYMVKILQIPQMHEQLLVEGKLIDWDAVNDSERACGLPLTPCPEHIAELRRILKKDASK